MTIRLSELLRKTVASDLFATTILGEPASKANSRKVVLIKGKVRVIKSKKALEYLKAFELQIKSRNVLYDTDLVAGMVIHYASRRPDLDESLILDALQGVVYTNDRLVKAKYILHTLDKNKPRTDIVIGPIDKLKEVVACTDNFLEISAQ